MLTQADISCLPASRELDALVAEKVMGLFLHRYVSEDIEPVVLNRDESKVPPYSTSLAAAWQVVEHFTNCPAGFGLRKMSAWEALIVFPGGAECSARADTAPLAICRAALKAVSAPIPIHSHGTIRSGKIQGVP